MTAEQEAITEWNLRKAQKELAITVNRKPAGHGPYLWSLPAGRMTDRFQQRWEYDGVSGFAIPVRQNH
jgi:hypothetical protein